MSFVPIDPESFASMTAPVRTRFAPSPTGYMHIGGMRTALFNWLWARHNGGQFVLRIDDTDQERNVTEALEPIFRAFRWLGLDWDEGPDVGGPYGPYYQSQRGELYKAAIEQLLKAGHAYQDFETPEQIAEDRAADELQKTTYVSRRRSLELSETERQERVASGQPYVIRLLVPRGRTIAVEDAVRGHVQWDCNLMPDPVLQRSNGSSLYNFATVVDDAQLKISHVIRAEEHLTNTAVQLLLHEALGNPAPVFAHIPFITAPGSTKKLSKRDLLKLKNNPQLKKLFDRADELFPRLGLGDSTSLSPVMVEYYERLGYLPAGVLNALSRLGWSLDDKTEYLSLAEVTQHFTLDRIVKKPAGFDADKLASYEAYWMGQLPLEQKVAGCRFFVEQMTEKEGWLLPTDEELGRVILGMGDRLKVFSDILDYPEFFQADETLKRDEKAVKQRVVDVPETRVWLHDLAELFRRAEAFETADCEAILHQFTESRGLKLGQIVHALRLAVTGRTAGVGLAETLSILGQERCVRRIEPFLESLPKSAEA